MPLSLVEVSFLSRSLYPVSFLILISWLTYYFKCSDFKVCQFVKYILFVLHFDVYNAVNIECVMQEECGGSDGSSLHARLHTSA
jgi:hypothetical protein